MVAVFCETATWGKRCQSHLYWLKSACRPCPATRGNRLALSWFCILPEYLMHISAESSWTHLGYENSTNPYFGLQSTLGIVMFSNRIFFSKLRPGVQLIGIGHLCWYWNLIWSSDASGESDSCKSSGLSLLELNVPQRFWESDGGVSG